MIEPVATKCRKCGFIAYPPKAACPRCGSREIEEYSLPSRGTVKSFTILKVPVRGFEDYVPLIIALVDLGGATVLTQLIDVRPEEVHVGMKVEATIDTVARTIDGAKPYMVKFRPVRSEEGGLTQE